MVGDAAAYRHGLAVVPDGSAVVVANEQDSTVAALSTTTGALLWETTLGGRGSVRRLPLARPAVVVDVAGPVLEAQIWQATHPGEEIPPALIAELLDRGGIRPAALRAWSKGRPCDCRPLRTALTVAPGEGDGD